MGRHRTKVEIDSETMMDAMRSKGYTKSSMAKTIGYARESVTKAINTGEMDRGMISMIANRLAIDEETFIKREREPMSQNEMILEYMKTHKEEGITAREALNHIGCMRLSARIHDLRSMGYNISMDLVDVPIRGGRKTKVSRYRLNG